MDSIKITVQLMYERRLAPLDDNIFLLVDLLGKYQFWVELITYLLTCCRCPDSECDIYVLHFETEQKVTRHCLRSMYWPYGNR